MKSGDLFELKFRRCDLETPVVSMWLCFHSSGNDLYADHFSVCSNVIADCCIWGCS